jgi:hypothetical protein
MTQAYTPSQCENCLLRVQCPPGLNPVAVDCSNDSSNTLSVNSRQGTTSTQRTYELGNWLQALIQGAAQGSNIPTTTTTAEGNFLQSLLTRDNSQVTNNPLLQVLEALVSGAGTFPGRSSIDTIMARNPYSTDYETATKGLYDRIVGERRADAMSGPTNVRGGQARTAFELADIDTQASLNRFREVRGQQDKEAGVVMDAVKIANAMEQMRRGTGMQAAGMREGAVRGQTQESLGALNHLSRMRTNNSANLTMAAELLGTPRTTSNENVFGVGNMDTSSHHLGAGISCCFIFMEAYNGTLPWYIRKGRDEFVTPRRRRGYNWMSRWLVPVMRRYRRVREFVDFVLIRPFSRIGKAHYEPDASLKDVAVWLTHRPYCQAWFWLWATIGTFVKEK